VAPVDVEVGEAKEATVDKEQQKTVDEKKPEVNENTSGKVLYINLNADAGGDVADHRLRHAIDADGLGSQSILQQADCGSGEGSGDGITARDCEEDGDDEWKIEDGETGEGSREKRLQQDRAQRHQHRHRRGEAMLL